MIDSESYKKYSFKNNVIPNFHISKEPKEVWMSDSDYKKLASRSELKHVIALLKVSGILISFTNCQMQPKLPFVFSKTAAVLSLCCYVFITSEVLFCGATQFVTGSVVAFNFSVLLMSFILWVDVYRKKQKFSEVIIRLDNANNELGEQVPYLNFTNQMIAVCCYTCFLPILASLCSLFAIQENSLEFYLHCYLFGQKIPILNYYVKMATLLAFLTIENFVHFFFSNVTTALIFFLYQCLSRTLRVFDESLKKCIRNDVEGHQIDKMFDTYVKIRNVYVSLRDITSLPVSLILMQKFLTLFFALSVTLSNDTRQILIEIIESSFFASNAVLVLILLIISGSKVKEAHENLREHCLDWWVRCRQHSSQTERVEVLLLLKSFVERHDMAMTAAGVVFLSRSLFLQMVAALVTYGVIMVQLDQINDS